MYAQGVGRRCKGPSFEGSGFERRGCERTCLGPWVSGWVRVAGSLAVLAALACGHAEPAASAGHAERAAGLLAPRPEQVVQSIHPAPAAAVGNPLEQPSVEKSAAAQAGVQATDHAKSGGAASGNQITMKHVEAELNRLEAELAK
jgi:hypothetical protein